MRSNVNRERDEDEMEIEMQKMQKKSVSTPACDIVFLLRLEQMIDRASQLRATALRCVAFYAIQKHPHTPLRSPPPDGHYVYISLSCWFELGCWVGLVILCL